MSGTPSIQQERQEFHKDPQQYNPRDEVLVPNPASDVQNSPRNIHSVRWAFVVVASLSMILLNALDNTIVANIIPAIINDLGHTEQLPWLGVGYPLGALATALPIGKLYGIFNTKWMYIVSVAIFMVGSALCGGAPNMNAMIVGRIFAGAGGNGMYLGVITVFSTKTTEREKPNYLAFTGLTYGVGTILGPVIGGAFADSSAGWRWGFYINLVVGAVCAPVYLLMVPSHSPQSSIKLAVRFGGFDYLGSILQIGFFISVIMAIKFGGTLYSWDSGSIIALFVVAGLLLTTFAVQQSCSFLTSKENRLFPVHLLKRKESVLLFIAMAANNAATFVLIYYIPLYFQFTRGGSSLSSGVNLLALIVPAMVAMMLNGALMSKTGYYMPWYVGGSALLLIGGALLSKIDVTTSNSRVFGYESLCGIAVGSYLQAGFAVCQSLLPKDQLPNAAVLISLGQMLGILSGLSISGAVFINTSLSELQTVLPDVPRDTIIGALSGTSSGFLGTLENSLQTRVLEVIMSSLQKTLTLVYVAGAVSLLASIFLSRIKLDFSSPQHSS